MPTNEIWINDHAIQTEWRQKLTVDDLAICFANLKKMIGSSDSPVDILFDLRGAGAVPADAPVLALRSKFLSSAKVRKMVVVSTDVIPQILAKVASRVSQRDILFFPEYDSACEYLKAFEVDWVS